MGTSGVPPLAAAPAVPASAPDTQKVAAPTERQPLPAVRWDVVVTVDPALYGTPNPAAPLNEPVRTFTLFETETMIGRGGKGIRVQIPIPNDDGVSRRQALLVRRSDNTLVVRDLSSANGTQLNRVELAAGVDTPVKDGDVIAIGAWTKLTIRAVPAAPDAAS